MHNQFRAGIDLEGLIPELRRTSHFSLMGSEAEIQCLKIASKLDNLGWVLYVLYCGWIFCVLTGLPVPSCYINSCYSLAFLVM